MNDFIFFGVLIFMLGIVVTCLSAHWFWRRRQARFQSHPLDADFVAEYTDGSFELPCKTPSETSANGHGNERLASTEFDSEIDGSLPEGHSQTMRQKYQRRTQKKRLPRPASQGTSVEKSYED